MDPSFEDIAPDQPAPDHLAPSQPAPTQTNTGTRGTVSQIPETQQANEDKDKGKFKRTQPAVTLVPVLGPTAYKDAEDKTPKSMEYLAVQGDVLEYMDYKAADELTADEAAAFVNKLAPPGKNPTVREVLRLCYYMREIGFSTYAQKGTKDSIMRFYVANPNYNSRSPKHDALYWKQDYRTQAVTRVGEPAVPLANRGRRGAISEGALPVDVEQVRQQSNLLGTSHHNTSSGSATDELAEALAVADLSAEAWADMALPNQTSAINAFDTEVEAFFGRVPPPSPK